MGRLSVTAETSASDPGTEAQTPHNLQLQPHNSVEPPLEKPRGPALFGTPAAVALSHRTLARPLDTWGFWDYSLREKILIGGFWLQLEPGDSNNNNCKVIVAINRLSPAQQFSFC